MKLRSGNKIEVEKIKSDKLKPEKRQIKVILKRISREELDRYLNPEIVNVVKLPNNNNTIDENVHESNDVQAAQLARVDGALRDHVENDNFGTNTENARMVIFGPENLSEDSFESVDESQPRVEPQRQRKMSEFIRRPDPLRTKEGNISENWRRFKRNFDIYLNAAELNTKPDATKINVFLNVIGEEAVEMYDTLQLTNEERANYTAVVKAVNDFCEPKKNTVYERFVFYKRKQKEGESFDSFLVDIKRLVKDCGFAAIENEMLRDRIVMGVSDKKLQMRLMEIADLTYEKAVEKGRASEATKEQTDEMNKIVATVSEVKQSNNNANRGNAKSTWHKKKPFKYEHRQSKQQQQQNGSQQQRGAPNGQMSRKSETNGPNCRFCNFKHVLGARNCPAYGKECGNCKKMNHFQAVCRVKNVQSINSHDFDEISNAYINSLTQITSENVHVSHCSSNTTNIEHKPVWREDVRINDKLVSFKIDTGSDVVVLPKKLLDLVAPGCSLYRSKTALRAFGGEIVRPIGTCVLDCFLNGKKQKINIEIVDFDTVPLLGLDACIAFDLVNARKITNRRVTFLGLSN